MAGIVRRNKTLVVAYGWLWVTVWAYNNFVSHAVVPSLAWAVALWAVAFALAYTGPRSLTTYAPGTLTGGYAAFASAVVYGLLRDGAFGRVPSALGAVLLGTMAAFAVAALYDAGRKA